MPKTEYKPVPHDHDVFLKKALERKGFAEAYEGLEDEYTLVRELLAARMRAGLTQEQVAASMGTTKSAVSRLEGAGAGVEVPVPVTVAPVGPIRGRHAVLGAADRVGLGGKERVDHGVQQGAHQIR